MNGRNLTKDELELSAMASKHLGYSVTLYQNDNWFCNPSDQNKKSGWGESWSEAILDCDRENAN